MVNLFLYYYEKKWLLGTKKGDVRKLRLFSNTFRFIDDLCVINDHLEFDRNFKNIYSSELRLNKENISTSEASFLDLSIITEKNLRLSPMIREMHSLFLLFVCHIWTVILHQMFTLHLQTLQNFKVC